jgi:hypothetical protein
MENLSVKSQFKKNKTQPKRLAKSIELTQKLLDFLRWLNSEGTNTSKFTRELWMGTPEWDQFEEKYSEIKKWVNKK